MAPRARNKFGAPMFEPKVFREQIYCAEVSTCDIVGTFWRPPWFDAWGTVPLWCAPGSRGQKTLRITVLTEVDRGELNSNNNFNKNKSTMTKDFQNIVWSACDAQKAAHSATVLTSSGVFSLKRMADPPSSSSG